MELNKNLTVDLALKRFNVINLVQNDSARTITFTILDNGTPFNLTGLTVRAYSSTDYYKDLTIIDTTSGTCKLKIDSQMINKSGDIDLQLRISDGNTILTSFAIKLKADKSLIEDSSLASSDEFNSLDTALNKVHQWNNYFSETSGQLETKYTTRLTALENIEVGGRNYIRNSTFKDKTGWVDDDTESKNAGFFGCTGTATFNNGLTITGTVKKEEGSSDVCARINTMSIEQLVEFKNGGDFIFSIAKGYIFNNCSIKLSFFSWNSAWEMYNDGATIEFNNLNKPFYLKSEYYRDKLRVILDVMPLTTNDGDTFSCYIPGIKLEKGDKQTAFTEAPEDIEDEIGVLDGKIWMIKTLFDSNFKTALTNMLYPVGSIKITVDNIDPGDSLECGTWELIGQGQALVGVGTGKDKNGVSKTFTAGANAGEYEHLLQESENNFYKSSNESTRHGLSLDSDGGTGFCGRVGVTQDPVAFNVTQPSFGVYIWKRTA